jgi:hypothetical protein
MKITNRAFRYTKNAMRELLNSFKIFGKQKLYSTNSLVLEIDNNSPLIGEGNAIDLMGWEVPDH